MKPLIQPSRIQPSRRRFMAGAAGAAALQIVTSRGASATPEAMRAEITRVTGGAPVRSGKVALDIPQLVENGNTVSMAVSVESPMTPADHVKAIHVFNEKNPQPQVISMYLGPRAGRAAVSTRIKLADTQKIIAIAQMSDGSFWSGSADVIVTIAACLEDL